MVLKWGQHSLTLERVKVRRRSSWSWTDPMMVNVVEEEGWGEPRAAEKGGRMTFVYRLLTTPPLVDPCRLFGSLEEPLESHV